MGVAAARPGARTTVRVLIVLALAAGAWAILYKFASRHGSFDLKVYFGAINYWAHGHGEIYDYLKTLSKYGYTYPPFAALAMLPMAVLPWWAVNAASLVMTVGVTLALLWYFLDPVSRRQGWTRWFVVAVAATFAAVFEPLRETVSFGQVNMVLLGLVVVDFALLAPRGSRWFGVGTGLATAIKLTPGIFLVYLLIMKRYRAAAVAAGTAFGATLVAALIAPSATREFWTDAVWDTDRVGSLAFISNQSLNGMIHRIGPNNPNTLLWAALVLVVLAVWALRTWRARQAGDLIGGMALTGVAGALVSPVTWIHHLVWLMPTLLLLVDRGMAARGVRRVALLIFTAAMYVVLSSRAPWKYSAQQDWHGWGLVQSSTYVYVSFALLLVLPIVGRRGGTGSEVPSTDAQGVADLGELEDRPVGAPDGVPGPAAVGNEPGPRVEATR